MNKSIIIAIGIIILLCMGFLTGFIPLKQLSVGDWKTGLNREDFNNCDTFHYGRACTEKYFQTVGCWYGNAEGGNTELIHFPEANFTPLVTSMYPNEHSQPLTINGGITYFGLPSIPFFQRTWDGDYGWYEIDFTTNGITWDTVFNSKTGVANSWVTHVTGPTGKIFYTDPSTTFDIPKIFELYNGVVCQRLLPITISFEGPHVGVLRVKQITVFEQLFGLIESDPYCTSADYVFLVSGDGTFTFDRQDRLYEEGETVEIKCNVGFSGATQLWDSSGNDVSTKGWTLKIWDNSNSGGTPFKTFNIPDGNDAFKCTFTIPEGAYDSDGDNQWVAVLENTLFEQEHKEFFAIAPGMREQAPSLPTYEFDKDKYNLGDTVNCLISSEPNPLGSNKIYEFWVKVYYEGDSTATYPGYPTYLQTNGGTSVTISFKPAYGDKKCVVEAVAFDGPHNQGGIPSGVYSTQIYIQDEFLPPEDITWTYVVCILIVIVFAILAFAVPTIPMNYRILIFIMGILIAVVYYVLVVVMQVIPPV